MVHITRAAVAAVMLVLAAQAPAVTITQVSPDTSLSDANWLVADLGDHLEVRLETILRHTDQMIADRVPLVLMFQLQAADAGKPIWLVNYASSSDPNTSVDNATSLDWNEYHYVLANMDPGWPAYYAAAAFDSSAPLGSDALPVWTQQDLPDGQSYLTFSGGWVAPGDDVNFRGIRIDHNGTDGGVFYLKQFPVPEPATLLALSLGGLVLVRRRRARK